MLLPALQKLEHVELRGVATASSPSARQTATRFGFGFAATDWHAVVDRNGVPSGDKSGAWKDPYHQGRAVLTCLELLAGD